MCMLCSLARQQLPQFSSKPMVISYADTCHDQNILHVMTLSRRHQTPFVVVSCGRVGQYNTLMTSEG